MVTPTFFWGIIPKMFQTANSRNRYVQRIQGGVAFGSEHHAAQKSPTKMALDLFCPSTSVAAPEKNRTFFFEQCTRLNSFHQ